MNFSVLAFLSLEFCTISRIFDTADSWKVFVTRTLRSPLRFVEPLRTLSPALTSTGRNSPVSADVSSSDSPSVTIPSRGILSPVFTAIISSLRISSGGSSYVLPFLTTVTDSGLSSISFVIDFLDFSTAIVWKSSPTWKNSITAAPSRKSLSANAPTVAIVMSRDSSKASPLIRFLTAAITTSRPAIR